MASLEYYNPVWNGLANRMSSSRRRATAALKFTSLTLRLGGESAVMDHTVKSYDKELDTLERRIAEMGGIAEKMVIDCMDALSNADTVLAHDVVATDVRLDALHREIENLAVMTIARR